MLELVAATFRLMGRCWRRLRQYLWRQPQAPRLINWHDMTYTRDKEAALTHADGSITWVAPNVPRITDDDLLFVEGERKNLLGEEP